MSTALADALTELDRLKGHLKSVRGEQIQSKTVQGYIHAAASSYFSRTKPSLIHSTRVGDLADLDSLFSALLTASRQKARKAKCLSLVRDARKALINLESTFIAQPEAGASAVSAVDATITDTLDELCPSAANSYRQALVDLQVGTRYSWRGPATDLREALRETLDALAPDSEVAAAPGFKLEQDAKRPTMKQKARFILRSRGLGAGQLSVPETAIEGIEEMVGGVVRSVYNRSSVSTHVATSKDEVLRVLAWVRLVLCELLELPL